MNAPRRRSLPFADWPVADQNMWRAAIAEGDILDGSGPAARWAPSTKDNTRKAYGYWLYWLSTNKGLDESEHPLNRITPKRISAYIDNLSETVASSSIFTYILDLLRFAKAVAPDRNWAWLSDVKNRLWARAKPAKDKTSKIRASAELFNLGLSLMENAEKATDDDLLVIPQRYRDGLVIALLAARPIRLKNFAAIEIDRHLVRVDNTYWLRFDADEVKNRKHIEVQIPDILTPHIERYCTVHRPMLLRTSKLDRLWISRLGAPLSDSVIRYHVKNRTREAFGCPITPHLFRDCAATSVAIEDPDHVRIAMNILGHHSLATTQRHYDQSRMLSAGRNYQSTLGNLRDTMRQELRGPYKPQRPAIDEEAR
jgi:site-specific recombinase XerD